jgi:hypothetical protein
MLSLNLSPKFRSDVDRRPRSEQLRSVARSVAPATLGSASDWRAGLVATISAAALAISFMLVVANHFAANVARRDDLVRTDAPMGVGATAPGASSPSLAVASNVVDPSRAVAIGFGASLDSRREIVGTEAASPAEIAVRAPSPPIATAPTAIGWISPDRIDTNPTGAIDRLYLSHARRSALLPPPGGIAPLD